MERIFFYFGVFLIKKFTVLKKTCLTSFNFLLIGLLFETSSLILYGFVFANLFINAC